MPPSFPVGGMENPRLSFITPTVIAGDKSLVSVIAHELAHSWSGNLVSNATWRDLWLNEGFTDYLESRIMTAVYGEQRASMEAVLGLDGFARRSGEAQAAGSGAGHRSARSRSGNGVQRRALRERPAVPELSRCKVRATSDFDAFLRGYFDHFAFKSITTEQFNEYLAQNLLDRFPGIVSREQVLAWENAPGIPADAVLPVSSAFAPVDAARTAWLAGNAAAKKFGSDWVTQQWLYFLDNMPGALERQAARGPRSGLRHSRAARTRVLERAGSNS